MKEINKEILHNIDKVIYKGVGTEEKWTKILYSIIIDKLAEDGIIVKDTIFANFNF